jgi:RNA polymerase sigma factor (sigma-70 family)
MPRMAREQEERLIALAKKGDRQASSELVEEHLPYISRIAGLQCDRTTHRDIHDDLVQEGAIALLRSIDRFDPSSGNRLWSFSSFCVSGAMKDFQRNQEPAGVRRQYRDRDKPKKDKPQTYCLSAMTSEHEDNDREYRFQIPDFEPLEQAKGSELIEWFESFIMQRFSEQESYVIVERIIKDRTMKSIGESVNRTESCISQQFSKIMPRIREAYLRSEFAQ